jgi:hypothetical protein
MLLSTFWARRPLGKAGMLPKQGIMSHCGINSVVGAQAAGQLSVNPPLS